LNADRDHYEDLLTRLSDGREVDWEQAAEGGGDPESRQRLEALRDVARIADFNRSVQRGESEPHDGGEPAQFGALVLLEQLGSGTSGDVWRAWDPRLKRELALKRLRADADRPADRAALLAEGRALAQVRHPNVVAVHGLEEHDGHTGLVMELVRGVSLAEEIERRAALPVAEVEHLAGELFAALAAVHAAGVLHRDVKPANLVRDDSGRWMLADFGLGVRRRQVADGAHRASGTPMFMPPECLDGSPPSERTDVYAAGATLWWALTGQPPFTAATFDELRAAARKGPDVAMLKARPETPPALREALLAALSPVPAVPPVTAAQLASRLAGGTGTTTGAGPRFAGTALLVLAVLAAGAVAWIALRTQSAPPHAASAPSAAAPAPSPASAAPYAVEATLLSHGAGGAHSLANGDRVKPGDQLTLDFRASQPMWVYVLNGDERGQTFLLFPQPLFDRINPLPPGEPVQLPGRVQGHASGWTVTSRGGREHFLVVASPHPVAELEASLASLPAPSPDHPVSYARVEAVQLEQLRGVGGIATLPEDAPDRPNEAFARFQALAGREAGVRGTWVRQLTLENPAR
jgi:serine/threonine protein kinase